MTTGKPSVPASEQPAEPQPVEIPAEVWALIAKLKAVGALRVLTTVGGLEVAADKATAKLGVARWLIVALPMDEGELTDGRLGEA